MKNHGRNQCTDEKRSGASAPVQEKSLDVGGNFFEEPYERGMELAPQAMRVEPAAVVLDGSNQCPIYDQDDTLMQDVDSVMEVWNSLKRSSLATGATDLGISSEPTLELMPVRDQKKENALLSFQGKLLSECGSFLFQQLLEVGSLRSQHTGEGSSETLYPLPTSRNSLLDVDAFLSDVELDWLCCLCVSLNSLWGGVSMSSCPPNKVQRVCLGHLIESVKRFCGMQSRLELVDWSEFSRIKTVDYKGEEVKVARQFSWSNIAPALPPEIGKVSLREVCTLGCRHYVDHFDEYLKPEKEWFLGKAPRVMVEDCQWAEVCTGLLESGVCCLLREDELHHVHGRPLLNGLFGVTKDDWTPDGTEIFRLIMNLIPLNRLCTPLSGDVGTLPAWSSMNPFFIQPHEHLVVSSEDVKCFFYVMSVPECWYKYLGFNKVVPKACLPAHLQLEEGRYYLASKVLPMGFLNSVSLAQHVHRNLAQFSADRLAPEHRQQGAPECELRKDRPFPQGATLWRIYLDNYDLLERVEATQMTDYQGTLSPGALALRQEYEHWDVPRNVKKSVQRSTKCEVQGATVDGVAGVAYPRESKLSKYFGLAMALLALPRGTQKQWQVVCGGLVYFAMFRRPILGGLNQVWAHIESFNSTKLRTLPTPSDCRLEVLRFLGMLPLAFLDFRLPVHPQVSCSDASTGGGGICASIGTTKLGEQVSQGLLRGELQESARDQAILVVGLFDGLGALRVAVETLGVQVIGYASVEKHAPARRVVESHFPGVVCYDDVQAFGLDEILQLRGMFSQATMVLLGAGPPCQGVSGLNADRRGALKDERSCLFAEVPRIRDLLKKVFSWCPVFSLMESVASMDATDRDVMSQAIGGQPLHCDAGDFTWCHRPRLYWCDWEIVSQDGFVLVSAEGEPTRLILQGSQDIASVTRAGWLKVMPHKPFPTFTTSRPRSTPGRKPAGVRNCSWEELQRWEQDSYRFPPYQYCQVHCLVNKKNELRVPDVNERELMLGFPLHFTAPCTGKSQRKGASYQDTRLTLLGNTWSVPVVASLLSQLFSRLGFIEPLCPQAILDSMIPTSAPTMQGRLFRLPLNPLRGQVDNVQAQLATRFTNLISIKGEDIMLTTPTTQQARFHGLRATVPAKCWRWKVVTGWAWRHGSEHINALELRAIFTSLRWRLEHQHHVRTRLIHLTDSLVCLHALSRGRSSSRKLRRTMSRINALLLGGGIQPFWGYVHTEQNPADKPSRWGCRVRTRFRHAKA